MLSLSLHDVDALRCSMKQSLKWSHGAIIWVDEMFDTCIVGDEHPGPVHSFKFRYMDDICSFLVVAHSLSNAQLFTNTQVRLEEIFPPNDTGPKMYHIGRKMPLFEGGGFLASFDLTQIQHSNPVSAVDVGNATGEAVADYIFIVTVLQSQHNQHGVNYTVRDNFIIATVDCKDPLRGLMKRCCVTQMPVFDQREWEENALASAWFPELVPPLIVGLESLLLLGHNATITLPLKCYAAKSYYKSPPPHLLRLLQDSARYDEQEVENINSVEPDRTLYLPMSSFEVVSAMWE